MQQSNSGGKSSSDDPSIWYSFSDDGENWAGTGEIDTSLSKYGPSLQNMNNNTFCVYTGTDQNIWWKYYTDSWSEDVQVTDKNNPQNTASSQQAPMLANFAGLLWCIYQSRGNKTVYFATFNWSNYASGGTGWTVYTNPVLDPANRQPITTNGAPAISAYKENLHCVYVGTDNYLWRTTCNSQGMWTKNIKIDNAQAADGNSVALCEHKGILYCVYRGNNDNYYMATYNGTGWSSSSTPISTTIKSPDGPSLCSFGDKLLLAHRSEGDNQNLYTVYYDPSTQKWSDDHLITPHQRSAKRPAISVLLPLHHERGALIMMYRGKSD